MSTIRVGPVAVVRPYRRRLQFLHLASEIDQSASNQGALVESVQRSQIAPHGRKIHLQLDRPGRPDHEARRRAKAHAPGGPAQGSGQRPKQCHKFRAIPTGSWSMLAVGNARLQPVSERKRDPRSHFLLIGVSPGESADESPFQIHSTTRTRESRTVSNSASPPRIARPPAMNATGVVCPPVHFLRQHGCSEEVLTALVSRKIGQGDPVGQGEVGSDREPGHHVCGLVGYVTRAAEGVEL